MLQGPSLLNASRYIIALDSKQQPLKIHPSMRIGCVSLNVPDLQKSLQFHQSILGFKTAGSPSSEKAFISVDGTNHPVELLQIKGNGSKLDIKSDHVRVPKRAVLNHFGIEPPASEFENMMKYLADHLRKESGYLQDPDGITIRLYPRNLSYCKIY
jgi:catechol-2,3-dioxygenase